MLARLAEKYLEKTASPQLLSERFLNRRPRLFKHMVAGMLGGAGLTAGYEATQDDPQWQDIAAGAVTGGVFGGNFARGSYPTYKRLTGLEEQLLHMRRQNPLFGKAKLKEWISKLEDEIYNVGMREYLKRGITAGAAAAAPTAAGYHVGKAIMTDDGQPDTP